MLKTATPDRHLRIQDVRLAWSSTYQYLGLWIDKRLLTFTTRHLFKRKDSGKAKCHQGHDKNTRRGHVLRASALLCPGGPLTTAPLSLSCFPPPSRGGLK